MKTSVNVLAGLAHLVVDVQNQVRAPVLNVMKTGDTFRPSVPIGISEKF